MLTREQERPVDVSVIVPNYSSDDGVMLMEAVTSIFLTQRDLSVELIVVDNASPDRSVSTLLTAYPNVRVIRNDRNLGFAMANNQGLEVARGRYLLMLNSDAKLLDGALCSMVEYLDTHSDTAIVGAKLLLMDDPRRLDSVPTNLLRFGYVYNVGWRSIDDERWHDAKAVFTVKGACALVRTDLLRRHGFLVDDYFAYFEETELCWRMWILGERVVWLPQAVVLHGLGKTTTRFPSAFLDYHSFKNRLAANLTLFEWHSLLVAIPMQIALMGAATVFYLLRGRRTNAFAVVRAFAWNVARLPKTIADRRRIGRIRVRSDRELFSLVGRSIDPVAFLRYALAYGERST